MNAACAKMMEKMGECPCAKAIRWLPLVPVLLGVGLFLLGYYLDPGTVRILWLVAAGLVATLGVLGFVVASLIARTIGRTTAAAEPEGAADASCCCGGSEDDEASG